jgi:hypothetical protein
MRKALRVLLLLFGVFAVTSVVVIVTHKNSPTTAATPPAASPQASTTTISGSSSKPTTSTPGSSPPGTGGNGASTTTGTKTTGASKTTGGKVVPSTAGTTSTTGQATTTTVTAQTNFVLFSIQGAGDDALGQFVIATAATQWSAQWSYNCAKVGKPGDFNYTVDFKGGERTDLNDVGPKEHGSRGSGTNRYYDAGTFDMTVTSDCYWTLKVTEVVQ